METLLKIDTHRVLPLQTQFNTTNNSNFPLTYQFNTETQLHYSFANSPTRIAFFSIATFVKFRQLTFCSIVKFVKRRQKCHITGVYRGAVHNACNLKRRLNPKITSIPVVFHNLRGYDSRLLMQAISKVEGRVSCIPNNMEKYISFSLGQLRFIDSAQFLLASLDKLVAANPPGAFQITAQHEPNRERRKLLMRRVVYPYGYMDTWNRFTEPKLPQRKKPSTVSSPMRILMTRTTPMHKRSGRPLGARPWETTATCTVAPTSCFWQMSLKRSGTRASASTA